jgi:hypothetical protein
MKFFRQPESIRTLARCFTIFARITSDRLITRVLSVIPLSIDVTLTIRIRFEVRFSRGRDLFSSFLYTLAVTSLFIIGLVLD